MGTKLDEFNKNNEYDINQSKILFNNIKTSSISLISQLNNTCDSFDFFDSDLPLDKALKHIHNSHIHHYGHSIIKFGTNYNRIFFNSTLVKTIYRSNPILDYIRSKYKPGRNYRDIRIIESEGLISNDRMPSDILQKEFLENRDLDSNSLIYGIDFIIDYNDINQPVALKYVTRNIPDYIRCQIKTISYNQYLETLSSSNKLKTSSKVIYKDFVNTIYE